jgi:hypothetical protein
MQRSCMLAVGVLAFVVYIRIIEDDVYILLTLLVVIIHSKDI